MVIAQVEMGTRLKTERASIIDGLVEKGSPRGRTHVILHEVSYDVWAKGGLPCSKETQSNPHSEPTASGNACPRSSSRNNDAAGPS